MAVFDIVAPIIVEEYVRSDLYDTTVLCVVVGVWGRPVDVGHVYEGSIGVFEGLVVCGVNHIYVNVLPLVVGENGEILREEEVVVGSKL